MSVAAQPLPRQTEPANFAHAPARLLIVDDHAAVRAGLGKLLNDQADFEVVDAVASAEQALAVAQREPVDLAVVDYQLQGRSGLWLSRKLKRLARQPAVLIFSAYADGVLSAAAVVAQADGVISKGVLGSELCGEIRRMTRGHSCLRPLPPWLSDTLRSRFDPEEQAIFGLLLAGIDLDEIAQTLKLTAPGLQSRLEAMLHKLEDPRTARPSISEAGAA